ncbi:MAG: polysaccharide deacetylase family protein, partial [Nitriliruptorales bacterium]
MAILCYHAVEPTWSSPLAVAQATFDAQCRWLARHRRVLDLAEAVGRVDRRGRLPRGAAALTFDDGFASVHEHALPVLIQHG